MLTDINRKDSTLFYLLSALVESAINGLLKIRELDRLHEIVGCARGQYFGGRRGIVDGGEHDDGEIGIERSRLRHNLDSGHSGHADVTEHE